MWVGVCALIGFAVTHADIVFFCVCFFKFLCFFVYAAGQKHTKTNGNTQRTTKTKQREKPIPSPSKLPPCLSILSRLRPISTRPWILKFVVHAHSSIAANSIAAKKPLNRQRRWLYTKLPRPQQRSTKALGFENRSKKARTLYGASFPGG